MAAPKRITLGGQLPPLTLPRVGGGSYDFSLHQGKIIVLDFWSAECPVSHRYDTYFQGFTDTYGPRGVAFVAIDSNVYEDEARIHHTIADHNLRFPVVRDTGNTVADMLDAQTTPHVFVFDTAGILRYAGHVDDTNFKQKEPTINYLEEAVDALLLGRDVIIRQTAPFGCTINRVVA